MVVPVVGSCARRGRLQEEIVISLYIAIPLAIFSALVQSAIQGRLRVFGVTPDLVLILTVSYVLLRGRDRGILVGLAGGIVLDALSGAPFGLRTIAMAAAAWLAGIGEYNLFSWAWFLPYATVAVTTLVYHGLFLFMLQLAGHPVMWGGALWRIVLPGVVVNMFCITALRALMEWLRRSRQPLSVGWR